MSNPRIQKALDRLEEWVRAAVEPELFTIDEHGVFCLHGMLADSADRLFRKILDQAVVDGDIKSYDYGSVIDPLDPAGVMYVQIDMRLPAEPGLIEINLDCPGG